jgi:hypothetical protein
MPEQLIVINKALGGNMVVEYRKDIKHNYMVITEEEQPKEPYCIRMLENQAITGVLPLQQHFMDNETLYYYDITGKQSMQNLFAKISLSYNQLKQLISFLLNTMELAYEHLLPEDDFIINPEYIYIDVVTNSPSLCFLSGYRKESRGQMSGLLEYLMNKVDYNNKEAVLLIYQLYAVSKEEGYTFAHLYEVLNKQMKTEPVTKIRTSETGLQTPERIDFEDGLSKTKRPGSIENNKDSYIDNIPVVMEKLEEEAEVSYYPSTTYILTGICGLIGLLILILGFTSGIFYNSYSEQIEFSRLIGLILILLCAEGYLMRKLWSKENKLAKIITRSEYIDPRQDYKDSVPIKKDNADNIVLRKPHLDITQLTKREYSLWKEQSDTPEEVSDHEEINTAPKDEKTVLQEDNNPTCLLSDIEEHTKDSTKILLKSPDEEQYSSIYIEEFPFFIGKLRKNVDYCLEKNVVSRYHAKLTKEEDKYYITDLNSTNGTFVNERLLTSYEKKEIIQGDRIALANLNFEFRLN